MPTITYDHTCLVSVVKNISGVNKSFGFLPPHGKELEIDEEVNVLGNILEAVNRGDRFGNRSMNALLDALDHGLLALTSTPAPVVYDATDGVSYVMGSDNAVLTLTSPCWEDSTSVP